jgi:hypothetical protein
MSSNDKSVGSPSRRSSKQFREARLAKYAQSALTDEVN